MRLCTLLVAAMGLVWLAALLPLLIGLFGFGQDPLAAVFLVPLGLPWNLLIDRLPLGEAAWPWLGAAAPLVNLLVLIAICRPWGSRRA